MIAMHPNWSQLYIPALRGLPILVRSRYRALKLKDHYSGPVAARALLAISDFPSAAEELKMGLKIGCEDAILLSHQINIKSSIANKSIHLSDDPILRVSWRLNTLLSQIPTLSLESLKDQISQIGSNQLREVLQVWVDITNEDHATCWVKPDSVAQQHLKRLLSPNQRLGGFSQTVINQRPIGRPLVNWRSEMCKYFHLGPIHY